MEMASATSMSGKAKRTRRRNPPIRLTPHCSACSLFRKSSSRSFLLPRVGDTFGINNLDRNKPTQFLKVGDFVVGTKFRITGYTEKYDTDRNGATVNVSELTVEQINTHDRITLVKEKTATSPESVATFAYMWRGTEETFAVKKDQEFSLKPRDEIKYKLLEVQPAQAILIDTQKPKEKIEIPLVKS